jgi:hypothetical protein
MNEWTTKIKQFFDINNDQKVEYYELHPIFILLSFLVLYYIIIVNSSVLIIFKQSDLFILFFVFMLIFSTLYIINHNNIYQTKKSNFRDKVYYSINIANILIATFSIIYLVGLFFIKK